MLTPGQRMQRVWQALTRWFRVNTFAPAWLGRRWGHPLLGVTAALLSQLLSVSLTLLLVQVFPAFGFYSALSLLGVAIIALSWGAGPSAVATLAGALLIDVVIVPPQIAPPFNTSGDVIGVLMYLLSGSIISALASQTERARRNAQTLAASLENERARLETILEAMPDAVSLYDAQGSIVWLNRKGRQAVGAADEQPATADMPQTYAIRAPSGMPLTIEQLPITRALSGETIEGLELRCRGEHGPERPITVSVAPLLDDRGRVEGVVAVSHDITALRAAESEAAKRASELEATFAAIVDGVMVYDTEGRIIRMNPAGQDMLASLAPRSIADLPLAERVEMAGGLRNEQGIPLAQTDWPQSRMLRGEALTGASAPDIRVRRRDGSEVALNVSGAPICDQAGNVVGVICLYRDVTERRNLERRAKAQMDEFLSIVSHELRTPVTSIKIGIQLMLKRVERPSAADHSNPDTLLSLLQQQERNLRRTDQQVRRLTRLLDDLIDLSRIRTGKLGVHIEVFDLAALVREMIEGERLAHPNRAMSLKLPLETPIQVLADPNRIGQVLTNYLTNALKYSRADQPVQIGLSLDKLQARVWVCDRGPGIPPEEQEHIWELFHRVPGIEVKSGSGIGLGLGLHISKTMIERHHGKVGVESIPGQGSTFWFTLPLAYTEEPAGKSL